MISRAAVVAQAREWLGTPYVHQHRAKGVAVDCAGLVIGVARELGIVAPDFDVNGYARMPDGARLIRECSRFMEPTKPWIAQPGDVVVGRWEVDPQHLGILGDYLHGGLSIIHALNRSDGKGCVIEHRFDPRLPFKPVAFFRMPGVA